MTEEPFSIRTDVRIGVRTLTLQVWEALRYHQRPLLAYHVFFSLLALFALSPLSAWLLAALVNLSGYAMVSNLDLTRFLLTPSGLGWLLLSLISLALLLFFQAAGTMLIAARDKDDRFHTATNALWQVSKRFPQLIKLAAIQVVTHVLLATPTLLLLIGLFYWLLGGYDIYYVINAYPPELFYFLPLALILLTALVLGNGLLYISWSLALPAMLLDGLAPRAALNTSWQLVRGSRFRVARVIGSVALLAFILPVAFTILFDAAGARLVSLLPGPAMIQVIAMGMLIVMYVLLLVALSFIATIANSLVLLKIYYRCCGHPLTVLDELEPRATAPFAWAFEAVLIVLAMGQLVWVAHSFDEREQVKIAAHRGASWDAPENSLAAIEKAIVQGSDYIELDVQQTSDGTLVLLHDRDLLRVAGDPRTIWNISYEELTTLDAGSWFAPDFAGQRVPTLAEAVAFIDGRAGLYLEVKTAAAMPTLVEDTVRELQRLDVIENTIIAALSPRVLDQVRELEPRLRTSLLVHTAIGVLPAHRYDALSLRDALITADQVRAARRGDYELHVWTVNNRRDMHRYIDMGVDTIITDVPALLREVIDERAELSTAERLLLRMRHWVW